MESVCSRLGLVSLSYLWRRDQSELLQEMIDCGVEAAIIKCAALGLEEWHLGKTLAELQPRLEDLVGGLSNRVVLPSVKHVKKRNHFYCI